MTRAYQVPGVYFERRPRQPEPPFVRTDVAGFIGFEPRLRPSQPPSRLTGSAEAALAAAAAAASAALATAGAAEGAVAAIAAAGVFGPVLPPLAAGATAIAATADTMAAALASAADVVQVTPLVAALAELAEATRESAQAARGAAAAAAEAGAAAAAVSALAARTRATAAHDRAAMARADAVAALTAARDAARSVAAVVEAVAAVVAAADFFPVGGPAAAAASAAASAAEAAGTAVRVAAAATLTRPVVDAAALLSVAALEAAAAGRSAAAAGNPVDARAALAAGRGAEDEARRAAATLTAALSVLDHSPVAGHEFRVDVRSFVLAVGERRGRVPATSGLVLSADPAGIPVADGGGIVYAVVVADRPSGFELEVVAGPLAPALPARPPTDEEIAAAPSLAGSPSQPPRAWMRIADVAIARRDRAIRQVVHPALALTRCDDWNDFALALGGPQDDGTFLALAVRAFFANGGARCYVATVRRPAPDDSEALGEARLEMIGVRGQSQATATGLERLLLVDDVMVVDVPDLYARRLEARRETIALPPPETDAAFRPCPEIRGSGPSVEVSGERAMGGPLYLEDDVFETQRRMVERCLPGGGRGTRSSPAPPPLLLFTAPLALDPRDGGHHGPSASAMLDWRRRFDLLVGGNPEGISCAALYFPWVRAQERVGATVIELPPTGFAAGVIARRDLARGPHVAPANETLRGVVGLTHAVDDAINGELYEPPTNVNALRAFPGYGIQVWGARTLSSNHWLRYLPVRRCLSAIERRVGVALQELVFEPNTPMLWLQVTQVVLGVLVPLFESGALRGTRPDEAFYVRCDATTNPPEEVEVGRLLCEVGVAIGAPAEFVVFRIGRREGVIEVLE